MTVYAVYCGDSNKPIAIAESIKAIAKISAQHHTPLCLESK